MKEGYYNISVYRKPSYAPIIIPFQINIEQNFIPLDIKDLHLKYFFRPLMTHCSDKNSKRIEFKAIIEQSKLHGYLYNFIVLVYKKMMKLEEDYIISKQEENDINEQQEICV